MLELTGYGHVPVAQGAKFPLIELHVKRPSCGKRQFGVFGYKGAWNPARYHQSRRGSRCSTPGKPDDQGDRRSMPSTVPDRDGSQASRREVILWCGGPVDQRRARALSSIPSFRQLVKELVLMGAGFNVDKGGNHRINGRREFNWWWDPEAVRMVMSASVEEDHHHAGGHLSQNQHVTGHERDQIGKSSSPTAPVPHTKYSRPRVPGGGGYMWDEIAAAAVIDPSIITEQMELQVNIDIDHGPSYGQTIFMEKTVKAPSWLWKVSTVQVDFEQGQVLQTVRRSDVQAVEEAVRAGRKRA